MKSLAFATYWLMILAVVGGIHSQHSEVRVEISELVSSELVDYSTCHSAHHTNSRIGVADAVCFSKLRKLR